MTAGRTFLHGGRGVAVGDVERDVFAATERLLAGVPIGRLSVAQIAKEAGVSRATFYYYFNSKFSVLAEMLTQMPDEMFIPFEQLRHQVTRRDGAIQAWTLTASAWAEMWSTHRNVMRAVTEHWYAEPELRRAWLMSLDRGADLIASIIDAHREAGLAKPGVDSKRLGSVFAEAISPICYAADSKDEVDLTELTAAIEPLLMMLATTVYAPD